MRKPKYRKHTSRDRAFVEHDGKRHYLPGPYKSPESLAAYRTFLRQHELLHVERTDDKFVLVAELASAFMKWARSTYPPGCRSEASNCRAAVHHLLAIDRATSLAKYGPLRLKALQQHLAREGKSRNYINAVCSRVKRMFKWGVSEELIPPSIFHAVATVPGLRKGRSEARETLPRAPVSREHVELVLAELSPTVAAMVELQWLSGARSQSICQARAGQFDCAAAPWTWRPRHKTEHLDHELVLFIGPRAQNLLAPFLADRSPGDYLFQPMHQNGRRARGFRAFYDSVSYLRAISRAIDRVNAARKNSELTPIPHWTPHQLRHARGTLVRERHGLEAAQAALGHSRLASTQIYAQKLAELAKQVALSMG
jgi:integrase